jgi:hypothetical protein
MADEDAIEDRQRALTRRNRGREEIQRAGRHICGWDRVKSHPGECYARLRLPLTRISAVAFYLIVIGAVA